MQRYLFSAYHFSVLFQTATFEMQCYLFSTWMTLLKYFIFPYFFKPQRLKYNIWNATLFVFRVSFSCTFSNSNVWNTTLLVFRVSFFHTFSNRNVWNAKLLVFRVPFSPTFSKISRLSQTATFENTTLLLISLKCLHYRYKTFKFYRQCSLQISLYIQQWEFLYHFIHLTLRLFSRNTTVRTRTW